MKQLLTAFAVLIAFTASSQVTKITLQASGLTCSMCSNSITKALKTLPFTQTVRADIQNSSFDITPVPGSKVDFDAIKEKVEGAGFFVSKMKAVVNMQGIKAVKDEHAEAAGMTFHFLNANDRALSANQSIVIMDKGYVTSKVFKKNESLTTMACYKTGVAESCCSKSGLKAGTRIYHVTI